MDRNTVKEKIAKIINDPWHAHVFKTLKEIHGDPLPELIEYGLVDTVENGNVPQKQITNWVGNYSYVGGLISTSKGSGSDLSVFWIRLYEIIDFLPKYFEFFEPLNAHIELLKLVREIRDSYSSDEQIMIEYQRNCHAHIHQTGYRIKANYDKQGRLLEDGLYRKKQSKVELNKLIHDELKKYSVNETAMAKAYFQKTSTQTDQLWRDLKKAFSV